MKSQKLNIRLLFHIQGTKIYSIFSPKIFESKSLLLSRIASQAPYSLNGSTLLTAVNVVHNLFLMMSDYSQTYIQNKLQLQKTGKILLIESIPALLSEKISRSEILQKKSSLIINGLRKISNNEIKKNWKAFTEREALSAGESWSWETFTERETPSARESWLETFRNACERVNDDSDENIAFLWITNSIRTSGNWFLIHIKKNEEFLILNWRAMFPPIVVLLTPYVYRATDVPYKVEI